MIAFKGLFFFLSSFIFDFIFITSFWQNVLDRARTLKSKLAFMILARKPIAVSVRHKEGRRKSARIKACESASVWQKSCSSTRSTNVCKTKKIISLLFSLILSSNITSWERGAASKILPQLYYLIACKSLMKMKADTFKHLEELLQNVNEPLHKEETSPVERTSPADLVLGKHSMKAKNTLYILL